tara:strand:+ start:332 stop:568 length:237 start_codon:yes stop_codon:yes gene_type:complete
MDIVERLRKNCTCNFESTPCGAEEECRNAFDGADEIERLRNNQSILITSFRINMMRLCPDYSHEEFDKDIAAMLKEKE